MSVRLISTTPDAEKIISYCARVSNPKNQDNENITRLLNYCIKNGHWSIFEMAYMTVEINTTISISSQLLRHKSFSFQQFSQRYSNINEILTPYYIPDLRLQDEKNRQNSLDIIPDDIQALFKDKIKSHFNQGLELYNEMIDYGIAKECARFVLPVSSHTRLYMSGNVRSWIHYLKSRCDESTQKEHRLIANQIMDIFKEQFPIIADALIIP